MCVFLFNATHDVWTCTSCFDDDACDIDKQWRGNAMYCTLLAECPYKCSACDMNTQLMPICTACDTEFTVASVSSTCFRKTLLACSVHSISVTGNLGPIARTPLNSWVYLTGQFEYIQRENRYKNTKSTLKSRWVHSNFKWRNRPLKSAAQVTRLNLTTQYFLAMKTGWVETEVLSGT